MQRVRGEVLLNHELLSEHNIKCVEGFAEEYERIVRQKHNRKKIDSKVLELLLYVSSVKIPSTFCEHGNIEKPKKTNGLYSMKIKIGCNIRLLFSVEENGTILLHTFEEIGGKSKTDYTHAIPIAEKRLAAFKGGKR